MYQKGEQKRDRILDNAKELFYHQGVDATTIRNIAQIDGDPVSLVHYYFKKKEDIIRQIYFDFQGSIDLLIYSKVPALDTRNFLAHSVNQRIYYDIILSDPNNMRVYRESLKTSSNARLLYRYVEHTYQKYLDEFNLEMPADMFRAKILMDFGARRELFSAYFAGQIHLEIQDLVGVLVSMFPRMLDIPQDLVNQTLQESLDIYSRLDYQDIKFLL